MTNITALVSDRVWELADPILEPGKSLTRFGGVNAMNDACDVSLFSIENFLSLSLEDNRAESFYFLPFCFSYQTTTNAHLTLQTRCLLIEFIFHILIPWYSILMHLLEDGGARKNGNSNQSNWKMTKIQIAMRIRARTCSRFLIQIPPMMP
jgi:hypothetical protein